MRADEEESRMSPRRRRPSLPFLVVLVLAAVAIGAGVLVVRNRLPAEPDAGVRKTSLDAGYPGLPAAGRNGESTCTDPVGRREWRVRWRTVASPIGVVLEPTAFESRATVAVATAGTPGTTGWTDESARAWLMRWSSTPLTTPKYGTLLPEKTAQGPLGLLRSSERTPARLSPRFVTPDGSCTVFTAPYASGTPGEPGVAVIGDSLVSQLGPVTSLDAPPLVTDRLPAYRVEVNGQGGRRWTSLPETQSGILAGDPVMIDEIRGLRGARAQVVALGTNDAGWVSQATDRQQFDIRLAWVLLHLEPVLEEIKASGQCTVVVTAQDREVSYLGAEEAPYAEAAAAVNDLLRKKANADPGDDLMLWDWAAISADHHAGDPDPWYGVDTVHLNETGRARYAEELAKAAERCA
jgi:lysophospholipase L1-like esterase